MRRPAQPSPLSFLAALGLRSLDEGETDHVAADRAQRLAHLALTWPIALAAQAIGLAIAIWVAFSLGGGWLPMIGVATLVLVVSAGLGGVIAIARRGNWPVHLSARAVCAAAFILGGGLLVGLWLAAETASGPGPAAAVAALAGALLVTSLALQPVRAAMLAMASGIVAALALLPGLLPAAAVCGVLLMLLALFTCRLARLDSEAAARRGIELTQGALATRMIAEFENQGASWFWETDRHGRVTHLSAKVAAQVAGTAPAVGEPLVDLFRTDAGTERTLAFHLSSRTSFSDYTVRAPAIGDGERCWSICGRPITDEIGRFQGFIGIGIDLTEQRRSEAEITHLALFDGLTGLANRQRMRLSLEKMLAAQPGQHRAAALFFLDLDRFKVVNDTLGHQAGDALLKVAAQRLQREVGEAGLVGRLGGDEFQVLLPGMDEPDALAVLARTIIAAISQPYFIEGNSVTIGCSIGVAIARRQGDDAETLVRNADLALYAAKGDGRGIHRFYSDEMLAGARSRKELEDDLRQAMGSGAFHLVYQPVVATLDERISGYEALIRWDHPTRGAVSPADFIPVAEECGMIEAIGEWVLRTACREAAAWPGAARVAVNVSPIQFANPAFPAIVASALAQSQLAPARLELEITEGVFLDGSAASDRMFRALKGLGVRLALDDFGTGYSSLGYLRTAPFDKIKIDQSFVRGSAAPGNRNPAIIAAVVTLARTMGMETTAEGVEVQDEIALLRDLGCTYIQGYVYGKGACAEEVARQLTAAGGLATATGYKVSRAPRARMLRSARIMIGDETGDVRIRDISSSGAMIDGVEFAEGSAGIAVRIELIENQLFPATLRWSHGTKAGIEFAEPFNLERLNQTPSRIRRAA